RWKKEKSKKSRYLMPSYKLLPQSDERSLWIGQVAGTNHQAYFNPDKLTTHAIVAGSTGAGKSVAASIIVEECLLKKVPAVVFDPTSQWTGFVKPCRDPNLIKFYKQFKMTEDDARSFKGLIYTVNTPNIDLNFKDYMNPGEVTVFNLANLKPGEYDQAVFNIVKKIFEMRWEESPELKLFLVFDEVHRLLEKYGGKGGYIALEKACREFRKWGIGVIMASQVLADFKEAVAGNILTEVQLNTKSISDIKKAEQKYGVDYANRISRQGIGVAMIQNPKFNDGKPWFVQFRPPYHSPHKITEEELKLYDQYTQQLKEIEQQIATLKKKMDTTDIELEFKLAKDKLKGGNFKMTEIYIGSLRNTMKKS
ncbi:hypothetical protein COY95_04810, partial [Candidatus Woesearchaeota archaeon CG_4_10_14_0_8_um_filter_47_5]